MASPRRFLPVSSCWFAARSCRAGLATFVILGLALSASAQGLLVDVQAERRVRLPRPFIVRGRPAPPTSYKIESIDINVKLSGQVARVQVSQSFVNTGSQQMEVCFVFPLPYDGAIDQLTLLVDGREYDARLLPADEARRVYEQIVRKNRDPALLEWIGTGMFKTSVFPVPPGAKRTVTLRYSQLCRQQNGVTDFLFPLSTAKYTSHPLETLNIRIAIDASQPIKNVYSPSHPVNINRPDEKHAVVSLQRKNEIPSQDFRLFYDIGRGEVGASVVSYRPDKSKPGYFLLLASPEIKAADADRPKKTVVFVVDRSGSMSGEKMEQAKGALRFVLNNLREGDTFNIIAYDSEVESFRPELERFNDQTRRAALGFVEGISAGGSTNIDDALRRALNQLQQSQRPNYVIFLTDGLPTTGVTGEGQIVSRAKEANRVRARLFAFGVGYDVNSRLLDKLVRTNFGQSEYVRPDEDIEDAVSKLYGRIGAPVLTDMAIKFDVEGARVEDGPVVSRVYPKETLDLFAGEQLVLVGRYRKSGAARVVITGSVGGKQQRFDFPAPLVEESPDSTNAFIAKLWATRRVGEIIDELDLKGHNNELVKELVALATRHGILTSYTSFLADENSNHRDLALGVRRASLRTRQLLSESSGRLAWQGRAAKGALQRANLPVDAAQSGFGYDRLNGAYGGRGLGGGGGFGRGRGLSYYDAEKDKTVPVETIQALGDKTFFYRSGRWVDSTLTEEEEKQAKPIERYSDAYFALTRKHGKEAGQYLALDQPMIIKLGGTVYAW